MHSLTIRAFRPASNPRATDEYIHQHHRVLVDNGVSNAIKHPNEWLDHPSAVLIVAEHRTLGMVGGIRVQPGLNGHPLPLRSTLMQLDPAVDPILRFIEKRGTAEVCGLWNAQRFSGRGLPLLLSMAAVSMAPAMNIPTLVCFVAYYTARHARRNGFVAIENIGDQGRFEYPIPGIISSAMLIPDAITLETAPVDNRRAILSLRARPLQERIEQPAGEALSVRYILHPELENVDLTAFGHIQRLRAMNGD